MSKIATYKLKEETENFPFNLTHATLTRESFPVHKHDFTELVIILGGQAMHLVGDSSYAISEGDVFVVSGKRRHGFARLRALELANIMFAEGFPGGTAGGELGVMPGCQALFELEPTYREQHTFRSRLHLVTSELNRVRILLHRMEEELNEQASGYRAQLCGLFIELAVFLGRCYTGEGSSKQECLLRLGDCISFMDRNFRQPLRVPDLAKRAGMSVNSFLRAFRAVRETSPANYLLQRRLQEATGALRVGNQPINLVAADCGFPDSNYFSRQFRQRYGLSPKAYRDRHGIEKTGR